MLSSCEFDLFDDQNFRHLVNYVQEAMNAGSHVHTSPWVNSVLLV